MKKFWLIAFFVFMITPVAGAVNMVQVKNYLDATVKIVGIPDFPPFAYYENVDERTYKFHSVFLKPVLNVLKKYKINYKIPNMDSEIASSVKLLLIKAKSGEAEMFIGAYSDTKLFSGLEIVYPAAISNPIHLIGLSDIHEKIKNYGDLKNLKGIACKTEYFSDFVLRKFKELNVTLVETPYEAYETVITGKADYMLGSLYYNRIMASRYGLEDYLTYSNNPIFKIPFFISLSKVMPVMSEYKKVLQEEFAKPEFAMAVKQQILEEVNKEIEKNSGIVPPSFIPDKQELFEEEDTKVLENNNVNRGHIVEQKIHQKTIDDVLDGI